MGRHGTGMGPLLSDNDESLRMKKVNDIGMDDKLKSDKYEDTSMFNKDNDSITGQESDELPFDLLVSQIKDEDIKIGKEEQDFIDNLSWDTISEIDSDNYSDSDKSQQYDNEESYELRQMKLGSKYCNMLHGWKRCYLPDARQATEYTQLALSRQNRKLKKRIDEDRADEKASSSDTSSYDENDSFELELKEQDEFEIFNQEL